MAVNRDIALAFQRALDSPESVRNVRDLARSELEQRVSRSDVLGQLESLRIELRGNDRSDHEDVVLDVMDFVSGWSSPHIQL